MELVVDGKVDETAKPIHGTSGFLSFKLSIAFSTIAKFSYNTSIFFVIAVNSFRVEL